MPNIQGAKKRVRGNARKADVNTLVRSSMRTAVKDVEKTVAAGDKKAVEDKLKTAYKRIDKAKKQGIIKENKASRTKSRLTKMTNNMK